MPRAQDGNLEKKRSRVFLFGNHPLFLQALEQLISADEDLQVCGSAALTEKTLQRMRRSSPNLVLVDLTLPGKSGLELVKSLRAANPKVKVLVMSMNNKPTYADQALRAGGDGYVLKHDDPQEILDAMWAVLNGHIYVSEEVMQIGQKSSEGAAEKNKVRSLACLSDSELDLVQLLGQGKSNQEIAKQLRISIAEVLKGCATVQKKLKLANTAALGLYAACRRAGEG